MNQNKQSQINTYIKWRINSGIYLPGKKIPSESILSVNFDCSRTTVRKALEKLIEEGFIEPMKGSGYFVAKTKCKLSLAPKESQETRTEFHFYNYLNFNSEQLQNFENIDANVNTERMFSYGFSRVYIDNCDQPFIWIQSAINSKVVGPADELLLSKGFSSFLSLRNIKVKRRVEVARVEVPPQNIRTKLGISDYEIAPVIYSIMYGENDEIIEIAIQYTRSTHFEMRKEITY